MLAFRAASDNAWILGVSGGKLMNVYASVPNFVAIPPGAICSNLDHHKMDASPSLNRLNHMFFFGFLNLKHMFGPHEPSVSIFPQAGEPRIHFPNHMKN